MPRSVLVNVRVTPEMRDALERAAQKQMRSVSNYAALVLAERLVADGELDPAVLGLPTNGEDDDP